MADLSHSEKRRLETLLGMGGGYVLDFSNKTFEEFVQDSVRRNIYDKRYQGDHSGSKANLLRTFWKVEHNHLVAKLIDGLLTYASERTEGAPDSVLLEGCRAITARLKQTTPPAEVEALEVLGSADFELLAEQLRQAIEGNRPEAALDRLHTFVVRFTRELSEGHGITTSRDKPLHSLFGEYVRSLRDAGHLKSEMTARILKSSISVLEAFNDVRNNQSLAHDNPTLNYDESLLIFNHVAASIRFLRAMEQRIKEAQKPKMSDPFDDDDIPF